MMPLVIITEPSTNIITFEYVTRVILSEIEGMGILNFYFSNSEGSTSFLLDQDYPYTMISNNDISQ